MRTFLVPLAIWMGACSGDDADDKGTPTDTADPPTTDTDDPPTADTGDDDTGTTDTGTTAQVAAADGDTIDAPLFTESFLGSGTPDTFTVDDAISAAPGDPEDWVQFTTPAPQNPDVNITFELVCTGTDTIAIQLWDVDGPNTDLGQGNRVTCATSPRTILLETNHDYAARVFYPNGTKAGDFTEWSLTVSW